MADPVPTLQPIAPTKFQAGPLAITVSGDVQSMDALAANKPFPNWKVEIGEISAAADTGKDIALPAPDGGSVKFSASAGANAGFGLYTDSADLVADLKLEDSLSQGLQLPSGQQFGFCVLKWGYDLSGSAAGSVALGAPASVTFGVDGARSATYAVVRRFDRSTPAPEVVQGTIENWRMPGMVKSAIDVAPGTWLIAETDGSLALKLGASYGYNFNWVRQLQTGALSGDIGLKLNAAISVALGFSASGRYAVVVSREPDQPNLIRVRLYKLGKKGWNFAFNGGVSVTGLESVAKPGQFDAFVQAVFGTHGLQIVDDLHAIRDWTDPNTPLSSRLSSLGLTYFSDFITKVTGKDPTKVFNDARNLMLEWLGKWDAMPATVTSLIWSHAPDPAALTEIGTIARQISTLNQDSVHSLLAPLLANASFFETPAGKWLDTAAEGQLLNAITGIHEFKNLQTVAGQTADILDGTALQSLLTKLHDEIDKRLGLDQIEAAIKANDAAQVDKWLQSKLAAVLGPVDNIPALQKARDVINTLLTKAPQFYDKAVKALNDTYKFTVSATYESTTSNTALIDASFDLQDANAAERYRDLIGGNYDEFLIRQCTGVKLGSAALTHNLQRKKDVEITLPFYAMNTTEVVNSLVNLQAVDGAEGRVLLYQLNSQDEIVEKNRRDSRLAIAAFYPTGDVRKYGAPTMSCSYSYRFQHARMKRADLQFQLKPYLDDYFPGHFPDNGDGSLSAWLGDLDKYLDAQSFNGTDNFGDVRYGLDVALPPDTASFWLRLDPARTADRLLDMSRDIQAALRSLILAYHFADPMRYADLTAAPQLLVYAALPISTNVVIDSGQLSFNRTDNVYWDYVDRTILGAMVNDSHTTANLADVLRGISEVVRSVPELSGMRQFYTPDQAHVFQSMALDRDGAGQMKLMSLLGNESILISAAVDAAKKMLNFQKSKDSPTKAVDILTSFGDKVTSSFNGLSIYTGDAIRPLGPILLGTMAAALCPGLVPAQPSAMLSLVVMKNGRPLPDISVTPKPDDVVIEQRIVSA